MSSNWLVYNIVWAIDEQQDLDDFLGGDNYDSILELPSAVVFESMNNDVMFDESMDFVAEHLSDSYGWLVQSYSLHELDGGE